MRKFESNFYEGQKVVSMNEGGPDRHKGWPVAGTIGKIINYDRWDNTHGVTWYGGFERNGVIAPSEIEYSYWVSPKEDGTPIFVPYIPEPNRLENGHRLCDHCASIIEDDDEQMTFIPEEGWVCQSCLDLEFAFCEECNTYHRKENCHTLLCLDEETNRKKAKTICEDCLQFGENYYYCEKCETWHDCRIDDRIQTGYGYDICQECFETAGFGICSDCHGVYLLDDLKEVPGAAGVLCNSCAARFARDAIRGYSYKPAPKYKVESKHDQYDTDRNIKDLLFGVELEIDKGSDDTGCANELIHSNTDIYCKHDGSLERGVEIVSHPCTLKYHLKELGWDQIVEISRKYGFKSHDAKTCGLHVHVGRRQLGKNDTERDNTAAKVVLAVYRHWENMVKFARRLPSQLHWAERNSVDFDFIEDEASLIDAALESEESGRYQAVNLCNSYTIEFRIFRGSLELNTIKATLEMVNNICKYCKDHTPLEVMNSQWADIAYYESFPELEDYLVKYNLAQTQLSLIGDLPEWNYPESEERAPGRFMDLDLEPLDSAEMPPVPEGILYGNSACRRVSEFTIGEYVLVTNTRDGERDAPVGHIGRVVNADNDNYQVQIRFSSHMRGLHRLGGMLPDETGYNISPSCLMHYTANRYPEIHLIEEDVQPWTATDAAAEPAVAF